MTDIAIIDLAGPPHPRSQWHDNLQTMQALGYKVRLSINETPQGAWPKITDRDTDRLERFLHLLSEPQLKYINALRGGYGCSNLLPLIPWQKLAPLTAKTIIGFSDITALQCAFHQILGWPSIHGPMPGNKMWNEDDFKKVMRLASGETLSLPLADLNPEKSLPIKPGQSCLLFGGCLAVLTNLIGTPYLHTFRQDTILFFEDIDENPGRVMRMLNQWQQSEMLHNVKAIVLGQFCFANAEDESKWIPVIHEVFKQRTNLKIYVSSEFGHASPNMPLVIGGKATIRNNQLIFGVGSHESIA